MMKRIGLIALLGVALGCEEKEVVSQDCVANINPNCVCTAQYDPVCGCDGKTYGNACEAACAGIRVVAKGACAGN